MDIKVGDEVCRAVLRGSNASRHYNLNISNIDEWTKIVKVAKVTKKYITLENGEKYSVDDDYKEKVTRGGSDYKLFLNKQECYDHYLKEALLSDIRSFFDYFNQRNKNLSLSELKEINNIIEKYKNK